LGNALRSAFFGDFRPAELTGIAGEGSLNQQDQKLDETTARGRITAEKRVVVQPTLDTMMKRWMKKMFACNRHHASLPADIPLGGLVVAGIDLIGWKGQYFRQ
jgi:hypothetical protein